MIKKKDNEIGLKLLGVVLSASGGFISTFGMNQLDLNVKAFEKNPALSPLLNAFVGGVLVFVTPPSIQPLGFGMIGASGGDGANALVNGLSRIEVEDTMDGEEESVGDLEEQNEAIQDAADELIDEAEIVEDDDSMS